MPERLLRAWAFDGCRRIAGIDHAVGGDRTRTLCGLSVNPRGYPTGERFYPYRGYACKRCVRSMEARDA